MRLADWMTREGLNDEEMAERLRTDGVSCDRTTVLHCRSGRLPRRRLLARIAIVTGNEVLANDFMQSEAAE